MPSADPASRSIFRSFRETEFDGICVRNTYVVGLLPSVACRSRHASQVNKKEGPKRGPSQLSQLRLSGRRAQ